MESSGLTCCLARNVWYPAGTSGGPWTLPPESKLLPDDDPASEKSVCAAISKHRGPSFEGPRLVAGAGFEPATFGL